MYKKPIIVFEGIEGSGKSYHIKNVANYLKKKKIKFIKIREPGGSINSEKIRKLILNKKSKFDKFTDLLLYMASRNENFHNILLKNNETKISFTGFNQIMTKLEKVKSIYIILFMVCVTYITVKFMGMFNMNMNV